MSPQDAVNVWLDAIEPLKNQGYALVGPVTSSNPNGLTWMKEFYSICNGRCTVCFCFILVCSSNLINNLGGLHPCPFLWYLCG